MYTNRITSIFFLILFAGCGDPGLEPEDVTQPASTPNDVGADVDGDPMRDDAPADSVAPSGPNLLKSIHAGGAAKIVEVAAMADGESDFERVFSRDLEAPCEAIYEPQAALCDRSDSAVLSEQSNRYGGPTWDNEGVDVRGILVIDACHSGACDSVAFDEARVFQAFPYSKVTHVRLYVHDDLGDEAPSWDDAGWRLLADDEPVGAGSDVNGNTEIVAEPTVIDLGAQDARYLRVDVANDGAHGGDIGFIEFRSIKLYATAP